MNGHIRVFDLPIECPNCHKTFVASISLDTSIGHLIAIWHDAPRTVTQGDGVIGLAERSENCLVLNLPSADGKRFLLTVPTNFGGYAVGDEQKPSQYGFRHIGPGVWVYEPAILVPNILHAFVTATGVPEPSPWEMKL